MKNDESGAASGEEFHQMTLKHDFRAALAALKILTRHEQNSHPPSDTSEAISQALWRLDLLVAQAQSRAPLERPFNPLRNLGALIQNVTSLQKMRLSKEFNATLHCAIAPEAAQMDVACLGFTYPSELVRVLDNLCLNSGQAFLRRSPRTQSERSVLLHVQLREQWLSIQVRDNGPGLPHPLDEDPFLGHSIGQLGGSGLGLLYVKSTIKKAGGIVRFETFAGKGTCFEILLPLPLTKRE